MFKDPKATYDIHEGMLFSLCNSKQAMLLDIISSCLPDISSYFLFWLEKLIASYWPSAWFLLIGLKVQAKYTLSESTTHHIKRKSTMQQQQQKLLWLSKLATLRTTCKNIFQVAIILSLYPSSTNKLLWLNIYNKKQGKKYN